MAEQQKAKSKKEGKAVAPRKRTTKKEGMDGKAPDFAEQAPKEISLSRKEVQEFVERMESFFKNGKSLGRGVFGFYVEDSGLHYCGRGGLSQEKGVEAAMTILTMVNVPPMAFAAFILDQYTTENLWHKDAEKNGIQ